MHSTRETIFFMRQVPPFNVEVLYLHWPPNVRYSKKEHHKIRGYSIYFSSIGHLLFYQNQLHFASKKWLKFLFFYPKRPLSF